MPRPEKYTTDQILDAAARLLGSHGPAALNVSAIATELGAPSGSIYHRFGSRDVLVATLWLRSVERFQDSMAATLESATGRSAVRTLALGVVVWARANPRDAQLLLLHRSSDLLHAGWPPELAQRNLGQRRRVLDTIEVLCRRSGATTADQRRRVAFAAIDIPYAVLRGPLSRGERPPRGTETIVADAVNGVMRWVQHQRKEST